MSQVKFFQGSSTLSSITSPQEGGFYVSTSGGIGVTSGSNVKEVASLVTCSASQSNSGPGNPLIGSVTINGVETEFYLPLTTMYSYGIAETTTIGYGDNLWWLISAQIQIINTSGYRRVTSVVCTADDQVKCYGTPCYIPTNTSSGTPQLVVPVVDRDTRDVTRVYWVDPISGSSITVVCTDIKYYKIKVDSYTI